MSWIGVDLSIVEDRLGYNPGWVFVPVHTDVNYSELNNEGEWERKVNEDYLRNPNLLFDWEGPALVLYSEHRQRYGTDLWIEAALGILGTMQVRTDNNDKWAYPDYETVNEAAFSSYAIPQLPESGVGGVQNPVFNNFVAITISWYYLDVNFSDDWDYDYFGHEPYNQTCFGYYSAVWSYCIP